MYSKVGAMEGLYGGRGGRGETESLFFCYSNEVRPGGSRSMEYATEQFQLFGD